MLGRRLTIWRQKINKIRRYKKVEKEKFNRPTVEVIMLGVDMYTNTIVNSSGTGIEINDNGNMGDINLFPDEDD